MEEKKEEKKADSKIEQKPEAKKEEKKADPKPEKKGIFRALLKEKKQDISEEEKQKLLDLSQISLSLDTYDDIFSDFDPRPFSQRALSDDFLLETKKAAKEKVSGGLELRFLIPKSMQNASVEGVIKKRLRDHFKKHEDLLKSEVDSLKKKSLTLFVFGAVMLFVAGGLSAKVNNDFLSHLLLAILEPAGWFVCWYALDQIFYTSKKKREESEFYEKMLKSNITFLPY